MEVTIEESSFDPSCIKVKSMEDSFPVKDPEYYKRWERQRENRRKKLEELKHRHATTRSVMYDEILALLEAELKGLDDIQKQRDAPDGGWNQKDFINEEEEMKSHSFNVDELFKYKQSENINDGTYLIQGTKRNEQRAQNEYVIVSSPHTRASRVDDQSGYGVIISQPRYDAEQRALAAAPGILGQQTALKDDHRGEDSLSRLYENLEWKPDNLTAKAAEAIPAPSVIEPASLTSEDYSSAIEIDKPVSDVSEMERINAQPVVIPTDQILIETKSRAAKVSPAVDEKKVEKFERPGLKHEIRQKRQILEEVILYDVDTFYEKQKGGKSAPDAAFESTSQPLHETLTEETSTAVVLPTPSQIPAEEKKTRRGRRRHPKIVKYVVTTDEAEGHKRLSKKDWSRFMSIQQQIALMNTEGFTDNVQLSMSPMPSQTIVVSDRGTDSSIEHTNVPVVSTIEKSPKLPRRKQKMPQKITYIVTYGDVSNELIAKGTSENLRSSLETTDMDVDIPEKRCKTEFQKPTKTKVETTITIEKPPSIDQQKLISSGVVDRNFTASLPGTLTSNQTSSSDTELSINLAADESTLERRPVKCSEAYSDEIQTNSFRRSTDFDRQFSNDPLKYVVTYNDEEPAEVEQRRYYTPQIVRVSHQRESSQPQKQHKSQDDIHFVVDYPTAIENQFIEKRYEKFPVTTIIDLQRDGAEPVASVQTQQTDVKQYDTLITETSHVAPEVEVQPRRNKKVPKTVTYVINYDEPYVNRPIGKYARKLGTAPKITAKPEKVRRSRKRKTPKIVTYEINYDQPYIDPPLGPYKRALTRAKNAHLKRDPLAVTYVVNYGAEPEMAVEIEQPQTDAMATVSNETPVEDDVVVVESSRGDYGRHAEKAGGVTVPRGVPRKARRVPITMTYVVNYDRPLRRKLMGGSYTGVKIKNWHLKNKDNEIILPDTVSPRAEIKAKDMQDANMLMDSPETRKIRFKPSVQFNDSVEYELGLRKPVPAIVLNDYETRPFDNSSRFKMETSVTTQNIAQPQVPTPEMFAEHDQDRPVAYNTSVVKKPKGDKPAVTQFSAAIPISTVSSSTENEREVVSVSDNYLSNDATNRNLKRKFAGTTTSQSVPTSGSQIITYITTTDMKNKQNQWDISIQKPAGAKGMKNNKVKSQAEFDTDADWSETYVDIRTPPHAGRIEMMPNLSSQVDATLMTSERTPEASLVIPESSSLEFPVTIPQVTPKSSSGHQPYTVMYKVNHDPPQKRKEWDIRVPRKSTRVTSSAIKQKPGRSRGVPQTMTYRVTHDPPRRRKEWDIKLGKGSYSVSSRSKHEPYVHSEFIAEAPEVRGLEIRSESSSVRLPQVALHRGQELHIADITQRTPPRSPKKETRIRYHGEVDIEPTELELRPGVSSMRMPDVPQHKVDIHQKVKEWDIQPNRPLILTTRETFQGSSEYSAQIREPHIVDYNIERPNIPIPPPVSYRDNFNKSQNEDVRFKSDIRMPESVGCDSHRPEVSYAAETPKIAVSTVSTPIRPEVDTSWKRKDKDVGSKSHRTADAKITDVKMPATPTIGVPVSADFKEPVIAQSITYTVNYGQPKVRKEWDIQARRPRATGVPKPHTYGKISYDQKSDTVLKSKARREPQSITYTVTYDLPYGNSLQRDEIELPRMSPKFIGAKPKQEVGGSQTYTTSYDIGRSAAVLESPEVPQLQIRPGASSVRLPKTSSAYDNTYRSDVAYSISQVEQQPKADYKIETRTPPSRPRVISYDANVPVSLRPESTPLPRMPQMMTYQVTYDQPKPRREWDINMKRSSPRASMQMLHNENIESMRTFPSERPKMNAKGREKKVPITVTYHVNYDQPTVHKEWDIKAKKPQSSRSQLYRVEAVPAPEHSPKARTRKQPQIMTYEVQYDEPQRYKQWDIKARKTSPKLKVSGSRDFREAEYAVSPVISAKSKNEKTPETVTYEVISERPQPYREWDIKVKKSAAGLTVAKETKQKPTKAKPDKLSAKYQQPEVNIQQPTVHVESQWPTTDMQTPTLTIPIAVESRTKAREPITVTYVVDHDLPGQWKESEKKVRKIRKTPEKLKPTIETEHVTFKEDIRGDVGVSVPASHLDVYANADIPVHIPAAVAEYEYVPSGKTANESTIKPPAVEEEVPGVTYIISYDQPGLNVDLEDDVTYRPEWNTGKNIEVLVNQPDDWNIHGTAEIAPSSEFELPARINIDLPEAQYEEQLPYLETNLDEISTPPPRIVVAKPTLTPVEIKEEVIVAPKISPRPAASKTKKTTKKQSTPTIDDTLVVEDVVASESPHTITYVINYDKPQPHKEWDFTMKKSKPSTQAKQKKEDLTGKQEQKKIAVSIEQPEVEPSLVPVIKTGAKTLVLPHTVTYKVNYNPPVPKREWDINVKKPRKSKEKVVAVPDLKAKDIAVPPPVGESEMPQPVAGEAEAKTVSFVVKYDLPISKPSKRKQKITEPKPENTVGESDLTINAVAEGPRPEASASTSEVVPPAPVVSSPKKKDKAEKPPKPAKTMTFIVKYDMPVGMLKERKPAKSDESKPTDVAATSGEEGVVSIEEPATLPSIAVEIPAVEVSKVSTKRSADKKYETITYVVNYKLPVMAEKPAKKGKKLALKIGEGEQEEKRTSPTTSDEEVVKRMLEGPETYVHVAQPSPEISVSAIELGAKPPSKKPAETEQVTYSVTYDVITKKKPSKKSEAKKTKQEVPKVAEMKGEILIHDVEGLKVSTSAADVEIAEPVEIRVSEIAPEIIPTAVVREPKQGREATIQIQPAVLPEIVPEMAVYVVDEDAVINIQDSELPTNLNIQTQSSQDHFEIATEPTVTIHAPDSVQIMDAPEMFSDEKPMITVPQVLDLNGPSIPDIVLDSNVILPPPVVPDISDEASLTVVSVVTTTVKVSYVVPEQKLPDRPVLEVSDEAVISQPLALNQEMKGKNGRQDVSVNLQHPEIPAPAAFQQTAPSVASGEIQVSTPVAVATENGPSAETEEDTVEVLKVFVPLIQQGTLHRASPPPPFSKVTYIVHHDGSDLYAVPSPTDTTGPQLRESTDELSCFGKPPFRKPIKFDETEQKRAVKPTAAVPPSVREKLDDQCILVKLAGDDVTPQPPIDFDDHKPTSQHFVVVAIDFRTTFSGYAFRFTRDTSESINIMRQWEGGDPGAIDYKTLSSLLLTPEGQFHSFGFTARDYFHDLSPGEAKKWMYFEKFKMALHTNQDLNADTEITASNGQRWSALLIFSYALRFFKDHALLELSEQSSTTLINDDIQWILTVPAIWKSPAKQFMRKAAYQAGIASPENPTQLLIALEPEAASISVRREKFQELIPESPPPVSYLRSRRSVTPGRRSATPGRRSITPVRSVTPDRSRRHSEPRTVGAPKPADWSRLGNLSLNLSVGLQPPVLDQSSQIYADTTVGQEVNVVGTRYMVVDCGGGTVDITVHEIQSTDGTLVEVYKATGGPYGSIGVDQEFEKLLVDIFGGDFIDLFKLRRPAGWVDLMMAFESRKRAADPYRPKPLNVSLPFSFTDYHQKFRNFSVDSAIHKYGNKFIRWSRQGMLRLLPESMEQLFQPTLKQITSTVEQVLCNPSVTEIKFLFLVGGFSESLMLQMAMRKQFGHRLKILIPYDVSLAILKGAVSYGCDPHIITLRKSRLTYGVAIQSRFVRGQHPKSKLVVRDGTEWCRDVFDALVLTNQPVSVGESVTRHYSVVDAGPASSRLTSISTPQRAAASSSRRTTA